jgi:hypothetical protein
MESNRHLESSEDLLVQKLGEAFREALDNGKKHIELEEFDKKYGELASDTTLEMLNKQVQKGVIGIKPKFNRLLYHFNISLADTQIKEKSTICNV